MAGNVRQLENTCRWLTVITRAEIVTDDLPSELTETEHNKQDVPNNWEKSLAQYADFKLNKATQPLLDELYPIFERILLQGAALKKTGGRKIEAAELLGWGRNTLTRKLKELGVEES